MTDGSEPQLLDLVRAVRETNPFEVDRLTRPEDLWVDASNLRQDSFRRLQSFIRTAARGASVGALVTGGAGFGKSHLLARLCRSASEVQAVAVFLHNLQASPSRMPRYLLKQTVSALIASPSSGVGQLGAALAANTPRGMDNTALELRAVLGLYLREESTADAETALRWFFGDELEETDRARLAARVGRDRLPACLPDNAAVEAAFLLLIELFAATGRVLVLCIDQIDNLDRDQVTSLSSFLHALIDHARHLVTVCSGNHDTLLELQRSRAISAAAWDRIADHEIVLKTVATAQASELLAAYLDHFFRPFRMAALDEARRRDRLFPLGKVWSEQQLAGEQIPRKAISAARAAWNLTQELLDDVGVERWLAGDSAAVPLPPRPRPLPEQILEVVKRNVDERSAQRVLDGAAVPPDADNLARLARTALEQCVAWPDLGIVRVDEADAFDLLVRGQWRQTSETEVGILFPPDGHGNAATAALKHACEDRRPLDRLLYVVDGRRRSALGAKGREHFDTLRRDATRPLVVVELDLLAIARLDSFDTVLALARVGDLQVDAPSHVITEAEAGAALRELEVFAQHPLLLRVLGESDPRTRPVPLKAALPDQAVRDEIRGYLAWRMGASATEIAKKLALDHPTESHEAILAQVIRVADSMHGERLVHVMPQKNERYLIWTRSS